nr:DPP IV N-terminal domain-containing protein [Acidobacteriota bacterium]
MRLVEPDGNTLRNARCGTRLMLAALAALLCLSNIAPAQTAGKPKRAVRQYTIEQFMDTTRVGGSSFSPDERTILFHSNKTGIFNVYSVPVAGGTPRQLTDSTKESTYVISYFPTDERFIYTYDKGGNENSHLYLRETDGRERDLTPGDKTKAAFLGWSRDRKSFYFSTNERDPRYFDVYEMTVADLKPVLVYRNEQGFNFGDISDDKKHIALGKTGSGTSDSDVYLYNTATKELKNLTPHKGDVASGPQTFDPDSKYLYYTTDKGGEFQYVARYDLSTGKIEEVEKAPWDVSATYFSRHGRYRVTVFNEDARTVVKIRDTKTGQLVALPKLPDGDVTGIQISPSETKMS